MNCAGEYHHHVVAQIAMKAANDPKHFPYPSKEE